MTHHQHGDRAEAESPGTPVSDDHVKPEEVPTSDPASLPQQTWHGKETKLGSTDDSSSWDEDDEDGGTSPPPEQILEALQCVYHQMGPSVDGAAISLNAILQGPYFDDDSLMQLTGGGPMDAYAINMALRSFNLSLQPANWKRGATEPHLEQAFLIYQFQRWFPLRRVGAHWINLSERVIRPTQILPWHLSLSLGQLQDDGCEVYVVRGKLPMCAADENKFFEEHFCWGLGSGVLADDVDVESECCEGDCNCYDIGDEIYEDELQAAIEASLADVQGGKGLVIKSSPPTSLISDEGVGGLSLKGVTSTHESDVVVDE